MRRSCMLNQIHNYLGDWTTPIVYTAGCLIFTWILTVELGSKLDKKNEKREKEIFEEVMRNKLNLSKKQ